MTVTGTHPADFDVIARVTGQPSRWYGSD